MPQQQLYRTNVGSRFQQVNRKGMPQRMGRDWFGYPAYPARLLTGLLHGTLADVFTGKVAREEPLLGLFYVPPFPEDFQQPGREHHVPVFLPFTLVDADDHPLAIDVGRYQTYGLRDSQPSCVADGQDRAMLETQYTVEKAKDFFRAENDGQLLRLLGCRDSLFERPVLVKRDFIEKKKRRYGDQYGTGRQLLFVGQIQLVSPNLLGRQDLR